MDSILYIHGFASSPKSYKAQQMADYIKRHYSEINLIMPRLSVHPDIAFSQLSELWDKHHPIGCVGSSLGGFYASALHKKYHCPAVLVNPSVSPSERLSEYIGENSFWHSDEKFTFTRRDVDVLKGLESISDPRPEKLWLMVQTHDETLDFSQATERYYRSRCTIEYGGDHSFVQFDRYLPAIVQYLLSFK